MRLLFLNRSFWPDVEATGQFLTELCEDLSSQHSISFIAGPSYQVAVKVGGLWRREAVGRVSVTRTWGTRLSKKRLATRLVNLGSYYLAAAAATLGVAKPDVVIAQTDPPLLGAALKRRWRCRLVYNVRDLYPDIAVVTGGVKSRSLLALLEHANRVAYAVSDLIIVLGQDMARRLIGKGVPAQKVTVVTDWADCEQIRPIEDGPFSAEFGGKFVVMYSGNLGLSQQLEVVLEAADRLRDDQRIVFALIGEGARKAALQKQASSMCLPNVRFLPYSPKSRLAESLSAGDLHLIALRPGLSGRMVPSKVYGIMAAGRPFIAIMEETAEVARLARQHSVGLVATPGDGANLARVVKQAADDRTAIRMMGQRARRLAEERFDRRLVTRQYADTIAAVSQLPA
ncbi:MAG: glycosyltransferase family 4 protein [Candidatus Binataceae bacterium]